MDTNEKQNQSGIPHREGILIVYKNLLYNEDSFVDLVTNPIGYDLQMREAEYERLKDFNIISKLIHSESTEEKQRLSIQSVLSEIDLYITRINENKTLNKEYPAFLTLLKSFKEDVVLKYAYLLDSASSSTEVFSQPQPKIQWLGKTNLLATLIYDLWQGQNGKEKGNPNSKPMIKADKKDLEALLLNNFLDKDGNTLSASTVSDYLNSSKPEKRAKRGARIELDL
ncbi:hypothetical protein CLV53_1462 [Sediminibacterium magnilacihabitans]|jgi:hypothetical protein|nr:hypothetical protein CLV53_1462 [Sediminibacterium magnilacihabitans]